MATKKDQFKPIDEPVEIMAGSVKLLYYYPRTRVGQIENALEIFRHRCAQLAQLPPSIAESRASEGHKFMTNACAHILSVVDSEGRATYNELNADTIVAEALRSECTVDDYAKMEAIFQDFFTRRNFGAIVSQVLRGELKADIMTRFLQLTAMNSNSTTNSADY